MMAGLAITLRAWGSGLWHFLKTPTGRYLGAALVVMAALFMVRAEGYRAGVKHEVAAQAERVKAAQKHVAKVEAKSAEIGAKTAEKLAAKKVEIRTITKTLLKEIPYAVPQDPTRGSLSVGFVRLHDAAVLGLPGLSDPAGRADATPSGVTDAAAASVLIANAETCRINAEAVTAWQTYWASQAALWKKTIKAPDPAP
jgi:hypothetical protein